MVELSNSWGNAWAPYFALAVAQNTVFLALVLLALRLLRGSQARILHAVAMFGFVKLLLPLVVPGPNVLPPEPAPMAGPVQVLPTEPSSFLSGVPTSAPHLSAEGALFLLWAMGVLAFLLLPVVHTVRLLRDLRPRVAVTAWTDKSGRPLRVYANPRVRLPLSIGMRCRTVFVPADWHLWPIKSREVAMHHEIAHGVRGDGWTQLIEVLARAVYFFHPLVWVLSRLADDLREMACDDRARQEARISAMEYTRQLQQLAELALGVHRGGAGVAALIREKNGLLRRVRYQMEDRTMTNSRKRRALAACVTLSLLAILLSFNCGKRAPQEPQEEAIRIQGFLADASSGARIAGARVSLVGTRFSTRTDDNGEFSFANVPAGTYLIETKAEGYTSQRSPYIPVTDTGTTAVAIKLHKAGAPVPLPLGEEGQVSPFDEPPEPIGGFAAIQGALRYPEEARKAGLEGKINVIVRIDSTGMVRHAWTGREAQGSSPLLQKAAVEAVSSVTWRPAKLEGKPIAVTIGVPVIFKLK